jgi:hypothetical protein
MLVQRRDNIAVGRNADGSILYEDADVETECTALYRQFISGIDQSHKLTYTRQMHSNGIFDPSWYQVNSNDYNGATSAGMTIDGRVALLAMLSDGSKLHYIMEKLDEDHVHSSGAAEWTDPEEIDFPDGVSLFSQLLLIRGYGDLDNIFGVTSDGDIWWKTQNPYKIVEKTETVTPPGASDPITVTVNEQELPDEPWSDWMQLTSKVSRIYGAQNGDGTIVLCGVDNDTHKVYVSQQDIENPQSSDDWLSWFQITNFQANMVKPVLDGEGFMNLFMVAYGEDNYLYRSRQVSIGQNEYTPIKELPVPSENMTHFNLHTDSNNMISMIMQGENSDDGYSKLYSIMQTEGGAPSATASEQWTDWVYIEKANGPTGSLLSMDIMPDGTLNLYIWATQTNHDLSYITQITPGENRWNGSEAWVKIGYDLRGIAITRDLTFDA